VTTVRPRRPEARPDRLKVLPMSSLTVLPHPDLVRGEDDALRCWWAAATPMLERYHDVEWGIGGRDEQALFERLSLEAFQAGLSWRIVLERREALREVFAHFDPGAVARFTDSDIDRLLEDTRIVRNRAKIHAIVANARLLTRLHDEGVGLEQLTEAAIARVPAERDRSAPRRREDVPASTIASAELARDLRRLGWRFIGPTTAYVRPGVRSRSTPSSTGTSGA
jgi:DNA-3-methyladenine glycosylase I